MNYSVYRGRSSHSKRLGFMGIFGRRFKRNHNYKYYNNVYLFRSGTFCDIDLSEKKNPCKEFIQESIKNLKSLRESLVIKSRKQVGVAVSLVAILISLSSVSIKDSYSSNKSRNVNIREEIDRLRVIKSSLENSYYDAESNIYKLSK